MPAALSKAFTAQSLPKLRQLHATGKLDGPTYEVYALLFDPNSSTDKCQQAVIKLVRERYAVTPLNHKVTLSDRVHTVTDLGLCLYLTHGSLLGMFEVAKLTGGGTGIESAIDFARAQNVRLPTNDLLACKAYSEMQLRAISLYNQSLTGFQNVDMKTFNVPITMEVIDAYLSEAKTP